MDDTMIDNCVMCCDKVVPFVDAQRFALMCCTSKHQPAATVLMEQQEEASVTSKCFIIKGFVYKVSVATSHPHTTATPDLSLVG